VVHVTPCTAALQSLSLAGNRIKNDPLDNDTFECLDRLTTLDLSSNKLERVPSAVLVCAVCVPASHVIVAGGRRWDCVSACSVPPPLCARTFACVVLSF
jgi:hypothetical protein